MGRGGVAGGGEGGAGRKREERGNKNKFYFKELIHAILEAGKSTDLNVNLQAGDSQA